MTKFGADPQATFSFICATKVLVFSTLIMNYEKLYHHSKQCTNPNHKLEIATRIHRHFNIS